jgi:hypothetical protein
MRLERRDTTIKKIVLAATAVGVGFFAFPSSASACTPYGLIGADWTALGGNSSPPGPCVDNETANGYGGQYEEFDDGWINWTGSGAQYSSAAYAVWGLIWEAWRGRYGGFSMGQPITNQSGLPLSFSASYNEFWNSSINALNFLVFSPSTNGNDGLPCENSDRVCNVYGAIGTAWWAELIAASEAYQANGVLDTPVSEEINVSGGAEQYFNTTGENEGLITWNASNGVCCGFDGLGNHLWTYPPTGGTCL